MPPTIFSIHRYRAPVPGPTQTPAHPVPSWRPLVTVNAAMSLDGKIAARGGRTLRLSDDDDLRRVHALRAEHDAILVGIGTVLADDPALMIKRELHDGGRDPVRVVLDSHHRTPVTARVASGQPPTILYCTAPNATEPYAVTTMHGIDVVACPTDPAGRVDLQAALADLRARGVRSLMVEGGSRVIASFVTAGYVDRLSLFVSPVVVGEGAPSLVAEEARGDGAWLGGFEPVHIDHRPSGVTLHLAPRAAPV